VCYEELSYQLNKIREIIPDQEHYEQNNSGGNWHGTHSCLLPVFAKISPKSRLANLRVQTIPQKSLGILEVLGGFTHSNCFPQTLHTLVTVMGDFGVLEFSVDMG
jgi:hypothetical protein